MKSISKFFIVAIMFLMGCSTVNENRNNRGMGEIITKPEKSYLTDAQIQESVKKELNVAVGLGDEFVIAEATEIIDLTREAVQTMRDMDYPETRHLIAEAAAKTKLLTQADKDKAIAEVNVEMLDYIGDAKSAYRLLDDADSLINLGDVQEARHTMSRLASEIRITRESILFPTYLKSLERVDGLIREEKYDKALNGLKNVLNSLSFDYSVIPLPLIKADIISNELKKMSTSDQPDYENIRLLTENAEYYIKLNELLGYGYGKVNYDKIIANFKGIDEAVADKDSDAVTKRVSDALNEIKEAKDIVSTYKSEA